MSAGLILLLCALACPVAMGLMMLFMRRGHASPRKSERNSEHTDKRNERPVD